MQKTTSQQSTNDIVVKSEYHESRLGCSEVPADELHSQLDNKILPTATTEHTNEKLEDHIHCSDVVASANTKANPTKSSREDIEDHVKNCIETVILGSADMKEDTSSSLNAESAQCSELTLTPKAENLPLELDKHIEACINSVVANSVNEDVSNMARNELPKQPKDPVRKKVLKTHSITTCMMNCR